MPAQRFHIGLALLFVSCIACSAKSDNSTESTEPAAQAPLEIPIYSYRVINTYPHDPGAYTQGLVYDGGLLYESTGHYGQSSLRKVALETGEVLQMHQLDDRLFAEGLALFTNRLIQLTWKSKTGFVYQLDSFEQLSQFRYATEGWGLTCDGERLIMSDGTPTLYFRDPFSFEETSRVTVTAADRAIRNLNELEWVEGEVFANIYMKNTIARIDPQTGWVIGWIDLSGLLSAEDRQGLQASVLNGIAYDAKEKRLFVTGKWWPKLYEIELVPPSP